MSPNWKRFSVGLIVCVVIALSAVVAEAQYYSAYYAPSAYQSYYAPAYQSYYAAPAYQTYYSSSAYQAYYAPTTAYYAPATAYTAAYAPAAPTVVYRTGWYPGYWLDRTRAWFNGGRTAYVASYPSTYAYAASYPAAYTASYPAAYSAGYAAAPCSSCSTYSAAYAPAPCTSCAAPACSSCSDCGGGASVMQTGYVSSPGCSSCTTQQAATVVTEPTPAGSTRSLIGNEPRPELNPNENPSLQRTEKPATGESSTPPPYNGGAGTTNPDDLDRALNKAQEKEGQTRMEPPLEAPKLFDTNDKRAQLSPAPVRTAVYRRPGGTPSDRVPSQPISWEKAQRDAQGWSSASK